MECIAAFVQRVRIMATCKRYRGIVVSKRFRMSIRCRRARGITSGRILLITVMDRGRRWRGEGGWGRCGRWIGRRGERRNRIGFAIGRVGCWVRRCRMGGRSSMFVATGDGWTRILFVHVGGTSSEHNHYHCTSMMISDAFPVRLIESALVV